MPRVRFEEFAFGAQPHSLNLMSFRFSKLASVLCLSAALIMNLAAASAQTADPKQAEKPRTADPAKDAAKKPEEAAVEPAKALTGPASNPECVWLGQRMINRLYRDDLDTAFRHLDLYDRFGCPGGHVQAAFRCVLLQSQAEAKAAAEKPADKPGDKPAEKPSPEKIAEKITTRVEACWFNPSLGATAAVTGTSSQ